MLTRVRLPAKPQCPIYNLWLVSCSFQLSIQLLSNLFKQLYEIGPWCKAHMMWRQTQTTLNQWMSLYLLGKLKPDRQDANKTSLNVSISNFTPPCLQSATPYIRTRYPRKYQGLEMSWLPLIYHQKLLVHYTLPEVLTNTVKDFPSLTIHKGGGMYEREAQV